MSNMNLVDSVLKSEIEIVLRNFSVSFHFHMLIHRNWIHFNGTALVHHFFSWNPREKSSTVTNIQWFEYD